MGKLIEKVTRDRLQFHVVLNNFIHQSQLVSRLQEVDFIYFIFLSYFYFIFLFLEQLGLGSEVISHTVTSVTIWWCGHNIGHETWENKVEGSRINDVIQHGYYMLTSCSTHGHLG